MSANAELARIFDQMAALLELTGANRFRINAYTRAARVLDELPADVADLDLAALTAIEGIGEGTAKRIQEYVRTGRIEDHVKLTGEVPVGLLEVMAVPGVGPKTAAMLWREAGVTDLDTLRARLETGELEDLPRMGAKTLSNIREAIAFRLKSSQRCRLGQALPLAEAIVAHLEAVEGATRVEYAGSLRRGRETIGDIDILATSTDPARLHDAFVKMPGVKRVLVAGSTKSSVRLEAGIQVDLRVVEPDSFGAARLYFTGSKAHNILLRERALRKGLRLNEYSLARDGEVVAGRCEQDVYEALGLPWIPPELREDRGELDLTETPALVAIDDIRSELHAHTTASDGRMSIDQLAAEAGRRGFHTVAVTDHSPSSAQAGGLPADALLAHIDAVRAADARIDGIRLLAGSEVDIHADGSLDYPDDVLAQLDIVVASPHASLRQAPQVATKRLVAAIRHPLVHVLGHPTGRLINRRQGLDPDIGALVRAAVESNTALEINAQDRRLDLRDVHVRAAVDAGALVAINTDAHHVDDFDMLRYGVVTARRGGVAAEGCVNAWPKQKLLTWLKSTR